MRPDMDKVIVERPRRYHTESFHGVRHHVKQLQLVRDEDGLDSEAPSKVPMKPQLRTKVYRKELNENLNPLLRFLKSNIGRPWNKVYSEVRQHFSRDGAVQAHVYQHLLQYVELSPMLVSNERFVGHDGYSWYKGHHRPELYVDKHGLLQEWRPKKDKSRQKKEKSFVQLAGGRSFVKLEGVWYSVEMAERRQESYNAYFPQLRMTEPFTLGIDMWTVPGWPVTQKALSKKQLSKKELKKHGFTNE